MSWLSGFSNRLKLTVDNTNIDDTLTDFPVLIKISDTSGVGSTDVTSVFTELGSDANRKKIAVTTSDETTQCYVEIERFDYANSVAWLWVKVPSVASGADTILYLYYDVNHADNDSYVGDTTDAVTHNVWDANFKLVMHMAQDPNGDVANAIKDSTSNQNDGTPAGSMTSADLVDGKIGKAIDFDGSNDFINCGTGLEINPSIWTIEIVAKTTGAGALFAHRSEDTRLIQIYVNDTSELSLQMRGSGNNLQSIQKTGLDLTVPFYAVGVFDKVSDNHKLYVNNLVVENLNYDFGTETFNSTKDNIAVYYSHGYYGYTPGQISEVRISNIARSASWIKATYYSNWDELVSFEVGALTVFTFSAPVPIHLSTTYGTTEQLQSTTTISGVEENYTYDTDFYDGFGVQVGTTVLGVSSGSPAASNAYLSTPSGVDYTWYVVATSSGSEETSSTYTFSNRFLYDGYITENDNPVNRTVRLYYRDTGELIDSTTSSGVSGYYNLSTTTNDEHFIVAFDDEAGEDYNALILDRLLPNGEE